MSEKDEQDQSSKFKVVDRRRFDEAGHERDQAREAEPTKETVKIEANAEQVTSKSPKSPFTFAIFIQSLAHQSLMAMGLVPWPDTGLVRVDLDHARETIDILVLLQEKTKGNLTVDEKAMFDTLLYELRLSFVQVMKQGSDISSANPPFTSK